MSESRPTPDEIVSLTQTGTPVSIETVKEWMGSEDIEVLGALQWCLTEAPERLRIEPPLPQEEYETFLLRYLGLCLQEHPEGEWADDRSFAGRLWCNLFRRLWQQGGGSSPQTEALKSWLTDCYRTADWDLQGTVVAMVLERLFTDPEIAAYFSDWQADPTLRIAYEGANIWGGRKPSVGQ
jgi:hypothetical protein